MKTILQLAFILFLLPIVSQNTFYTSSNIDFPNPERGFFVAGLPYNTQILRNARDNQNITVIRSGYRLDSYIHSDIPQSFLDDLQNDLDRVRNAGSKMIIRFAYNASLAGEDASESRILSHIAQLGPIFAQNSDIIVMADAGFIGAWGEWHASDNNLDNTTSRRNILFQFLNYMPVERMVALRTNTFKREIYNNDNPLTSSEAYNQTNRSRSAAHNDCLGASASDFGSYASNNIEWEKDFLNQDNIYLAQGGETCNVNPPYSTCTNMLADLERMRWDLLNIHYNQNVLQSWVDGGCMEEIKKRLGYRFQLINAQIDNTVSDGILSATIELENVGFGKAFNPRGLELILRETGTTNEFVFPISDDPRFWSSGQTHTINIEQSIPQSVPLGSYKLFLNLPDPIASLHDRPDYSIRLANENVWESSTGYNSLLHTVQINSTLGIAENEFANVSNLVVYPNPTNSNTNIVFYLNKKSNISINVFNTQGQVIKQLTNGLLQKGKHSIVWNKYDTAITPGVYWIKFKTGNFTKTKKIVMFKKNND